MPIRPENRHRYPPDWPTISRRIRFERAAGQCECHGECRRDTHTGRCPNTHGQPAYGTGSTVVLTVAHLDHTPENCADDNLRAMCQGCHLHYDRDHHRETAAATRRATQTAAGQLALFPEPARVQQPPTEHRWHVLDDLDGPKFSETHAARVLGTYPTLDAVRADYADDSEWLYDTLADQVYEPYTWPDTDQPRAISLHLRALAGVDA